MNVAREIESMSGRHATWEDKLFLASGTHALVANLPGLILQLATAARAFEVQRRILLGRAAAKKEYPPDN
jgi:hypothetical protein